MPDYQKGKIYKLWSPQGDEIYIGSTTNPLAKRFYEHKSAQKSRSRYLFENYDDVRIELIQEYPCNNKMELNKKEGEHIRENECLNKRIAGRTRKEYREDNKEHIKEYREKNKEHIKEIHKEYRENNKEYRKEQSKEWRENNKDHKKEYDKLWYENNKDHRQEYNKEWCKNNEEKIKERKNKKFNCECGSVIRIYEKARHLKTKKHLDFMNSHQ